jgi:serine/threonine protein kinase
MDKGTVVGGRYEILDVLGQGGMSVVYKARDRSLDEIVALKVIRSDLASTPEAFTRFLTEIKLARRVRHRNVCAIHEFGEDGATRYLVMEYIEGESLRRILQARRLDTATAFDYCIQIAQGLEAVHEAGILHRDLKTSNVSVDRNGVVRLMDFGIARLLVSAAHTTQTGMIVGTPAYMSPEQVRGERSDLRSDIYSFGIVVYEVFTGQTPFRGDQVHEYFFKHLQEEPALDLPSIPTGLRPILRRALAKKPEERQQSATQLLNELRAAARDAPPGPVGPIDVSAAAADPDADATPPIGTPGPVVPPPAAAEPPPVRALADMTSFTSAFSAPVEKRRNAQAVLSRSSLSQPAVGQGKVFVCYRTEDSADVAGRITDHLVMRLGPESVFKDVDTIPLGANFRTYLENVVNCCVVQLVIIGRSWLDVRDENGESRLNDSADWVRIEIEAALARDIPIIPLLVQGASMPKEKQLPPSLRELAYIQGAAVRRDPDFKADIERLMRSLEKMLA